jgi:HD superfamily phosphodiesterase
MDGVLTERARRLAEVRLASLATRLAHVRGVAVAAERLVERIDPLEAESLVAAAWLHDVGYSPSVRSTGFHSIDGAVFVRAEGFPALVVSLVASSTSGRRRRWIRHLWVIQSRKASPP